MCYHEVMEQGIPPNKDTQEDDVTDVIDEEEFDNIHCIGFFAALV